VGHQADPSQDYPVTELGDALQGVCLDGGSIPPTSTTDSIFLRISRSDRSLRPKGRYGSLFGAYTQKSLRLNSLPDFRGIEPRRAKQASGLFWAERSEASVDCEARHAIPPTSTNRPKDEHLLLSRWLCRDGVVLRAKEQTAVWSFMT